MKSRHNTRRTAGFTLSEVLIAVAILGILLAVAIPNVIALRRSMKMTELDAAARSIFMAAQDNLTAMRAADTLQNLKDAPAAEASGETSFLTSGSGLMQVLLPSGAVERQVQAGFYVVRFNRATATVLEVWYSEQTDLPAQTGEGGPVFQTWSGHEAAAKKAREDSRVGYYNGLDADAPELQALPKPVLTILDDAVAGQLTLQIQVDKLALVRAHADLCVDITAASGAQVTLDQSDLALSLTENTAAARLDSMEPGKQFRDLFPQFTPGEDLQMTVRLTPRAGEPFLAAQAQIACNSLFEGRDESGAVRIANARHLQNLCADFSGVPDSVQSADPARVLAAVQTGDILWPEGKALKPILNGTLVSYDGGNFELRDLLITDQAVSAASGKDRVGLFGISPENGALRNITMVNPRVQTTFAPVVGTLAGVLWQTEVSNCRIYVERTREDGSADHAAMSAEGSYGIYAASDTAQTMYVGGLAGHMSDCEITDSFVALPYIQVENASAWVGGFLGSAQGGRLRGVYAATDHLSGSVHAAAGLVGCLESNTDVEHSYAVGNLEAAAQIAAGLGVGSDSGIRAAGRLTDTYCAVTYLDRGGAPRSDLEPYPFVSAPDTAMESCAYLVQGTEQFQGAQQTKARPLRYEALKTAMTGGDWTAGTVMSSHPYRQSLAGIGYPFPTLAGRDHWGSWPARGGDGQGLLAYFEVYQDGGIGISCGAQTGTLPAGTLRRLDSGRDVAVRDGYGLLVKELTTPPQASYTAAAGVVQTQPCTLLRQTPVTLDGAAYYLYVLPNDALQTPYADEGFYQSVTVGGQTYWYEPHFADTVASAGDAPEQLPEQLTIRTARQLWNLGQHEVFWDWAVVQTLDVDYSRYRWPDVGIANSAQRTIGNSKTAFTGRYEGAFDAARGLYCNVTNVWLGAQSDTGYIGLFGFVGAAGSVHGVHLVQPQINREPGSAGYVGLLAAMNRGKITDCRVALPAKLTLTQTGGFGGLVGHNERGVISDCVVRGSPLGTEVSGTGYVAGFASSNTEGTISRCAVEPDRAKGYGGLVLRDAAGAGGVGGFVANTAGTITDSYAVATVRGKYAGGFAMKASVLVERCYANCVVEDTAQSALIGGFVYENSASIRSCYALGTVRATYPGSNAGGFAPNYSGGAVVGCYSAAAVSARQGAAYGFAIQQAGVYTDCFYLQGDYQTADAARAVAYGSLNSSLFSAAGTWTNDNTDHSFPFDAALGAYYPFARLAGLDHVGDWPDFESRFHGAPLYVVCYELRAGQWHCYVSAVDCVEPDDPGHKGDPVVDKISNYYVGTVETPSFGSGDQRWGLFISDACDDTINTNANKLFTTPQEDRWDGRTLTLCGYPGQMYPIVSADNTDSVSLTFRHDKGNNTKAWSYDFTFRDGVLSVTEQTDPE